MKRIFHPGGSVVTGTVLADGVMRYAEALSKRRETDVVDIPVITDDGSQGRAQLLIGASSQLVSVTIAAGPYELVEDETAQSLRDKLRVRPRHAPLAWVGAPPASPQFDEFDY